MKKTLFLTIAIAIAIFLGFKAFADNTGNYNIPCYKCKEYTKNHRGYSDCMGCSAWRRCDLEREQHKYMIYKCPHGHTLYVAYQGDEKK